MQLSEKIITPEDLLKIKDIEHSAFMKECENLFGPLSDDTFWKYREHLRSTYIYKKINFKGKPFHFIHFNKDNPNLIAFTANENIGKKDGKTFIKPGKYLAQYSDLDNEQIKTVVTNYKHEFVPPELFYAKSTDDAAKVYEDGPSSCMTDKDWGIENHPARVYYGPDTKLTYIKNKSGNGVSARSIVRTDRTPHEYIKIYGDTALMKKAFNAAGISQSRDGVKGCRFPLLWYKGKEQKKLIIPYFDGYVNNVFISKKRNERKYMIMGDPPTADNGIYWILAATSTSGYQIMPDVQECDSCNELKFEDKMIHIDREHYCKPCSIRLEIVIIDEGFEGLERHKLLHRAEQNTSNYFKIDNKWYSRNGLHKIDKFYNRDEDEIIPLTETGICSKDGNRYLKVHMLVMHSISDGDTYFIQRNYSNLAGSKIHINKNTYEFYSEKLALKLINEGDTELMLVRDFLNEILADMKTNIKDDQNYIPYIIDASNYRAGIKRFLKLYLEYTNGGSSYL